VVDDTLLRKCRVAAEQQMADALTRQASLGHIMARQAGALDGLAASRQDLWRLARVAIYLSSGMAALRKSGALVHTEPADALAARLRRRLRRALTTRPQRWRHRHRAALQARSNLARLPCPAIVASPVLRSSLDAWP
jgi:hypothetical protein